ncbi:E3 ubiquitin-protein ligase TRAIP-like [Achroia grisella]|uniref:E3 ubiquitin-protein ligase TRAIP-like n=1 Tax=Achroia grisella TaxID=688607 RepID=UPI0027D27885|nr:E3 ubiquitin-protein ligase TRAIP-like [Achroia grisella]
MHIVCTICSDLVNQAENIYGTKCGHLFHYQCLAQWLERSKSCPQCRHKVTDRCMFRIYPTISNENTGDDVATLNSRLDDALLQLRQQKAARKEKEDKLAALTVDLKKNIDLLTACEKKLISRDSAVSALKEQLEYVKIQNKETQRLKDENESLKKNMQTLNGLQKVLNATNEEVEEMLQGYTDVRTIATFATALKRALCESESKKNEIREKLQIAKHMFALETSKTTSLQTKTVQLEEKLAHTERKYQTLKNKRKASVLKDKSLIEEAESGVKQLKYSEQSDQLNEAIIVPENNNSFNTMVNKIENADSPYLSLRQSSLALTALQQRPSQMVPDNKLKPSEFALLNSARNAVMKKGLENVSANNLSIFHKKEPPKMDFNNDKIDFKDAQLNVSYDGLGGHSKLDLMPVPTKQQIKTRIPKLSAKHKLKKPNSAGSQDISKMLGKLRDK